MVHERIMGIEVTDDAMYQKYRDGMMPILKTFNGKFGFDFIVSEVLLSKSSDKINRVFTIEFPNKERMDAFFSDPAYLDVKKRYFDASVKSKTLISAHDTNT